MKTFCKIFLLLTVMSQLIFPQSELEKDFDILKYKLEVDLFNNYSQPFSHSFSGNVLVELKALADLNELKLNASSFSIMIDKIEGEEISYEHKSDTLFVNFGKIIKRNSVTKIKIFYSHNDVFDGAFFVKDGMLFTNNAPQGARNGSHVSIIHQIKHCLN